ncbi:MAG: sigma 54-interacting transcriptional regulator [Syntrophotaleaceae bacterium]
MKYRILVIDDEKSLRFTFQRFLSDEGYEVETAAEFDEALQLLAQKRYDAVFSDILLGGKTGIDVLRAIKERDSLCPVIMVTGYPNIETASEALRLGAFDYIPKPVVKKDLLQVARAALKYRRIAEENERNRTNLEAVFRSVRDALIIVDKEGVVQRFNEAAQRICSLEDHVLGQHYSEALARCSDHCNELLQQTLEKGKPRQLDRIECKAPEAGGQVLTLSTAPLLDGSGAAIGAVLVARDETRLDKLERTLRKRNSFHKMVGGSSKMQELYCLLDDLADVPSTVLITGESGTGKELVARAIHYNSPRLGKAFLALNCAAIPSELLESELFGYEKGAFTGATERKIGKFEQASGGTLFLDEIGDMPLDLQAKLLRVLQEKEITRTGGNTSIPVDVRIVAATNQNLEEQVRERAFREDLYYRLNVVPINIPSLRERRADIPLLVDYFLPRAQQELNVQTQGCTKEAMGLLMRHDWPGNVRELENALRRAALLSSDPMLTPDDFPGLQPQGAVTEVDESLEALISKKLRSSFAQMDVQELDNLYEMVMNQMERPLIRIILEKTRSNQVRAAEILGINRNTLRKKIQTLDIDIKSI